MNEPEPTVLAQALHGAAPPLWSAIPFGIYLLLIATIPLAFGHFWERNRNKLLIAAGVSGPAIGYLLLGHPSGPRWLIESIKDYLVFMALLFALFVISGGIYLKGSLKGTTRTNALLLAVGALLASVIGTTGASMLLIRPILRANESRRRRVHLVVFFIFIVSNGAGMLTPLGDPPLFLGFLRGVPFLWTLRLVGPWAFVNGTLLGLFVIFDRRALVREIAARSVAWGNLTPPPVPCPHEPLRIEGKGNLVLLLAVVLAAAGLGSWGQRPGVNAFIAAGAQVGALVGLAVLSWRFTRTAIHEANRFSWAPIIEVATVFLGIFITMVPALRYIEERGADFGISKPWQFFWLSGALSSFLDNAPTYLTFTSLAVGVVNRLAGTQLSAQNLMGLSTHPLGVTFLMAVSCGSVFMGANSYIGNGPNFMVKAIAEESRVPMPSFFGYMGWSVAILVPIFLVVTGVFFLR